MGQVGDDGSVAVGLVQIDDRSKEEKRVCGSMEEERRDGETLRRERRRKENEERIKNKKRSVNIE